MSVSEGNIADRDAPPTGHQQSAERIMAVAVTTFDGTDELIELGSRIAYEIDGVVGTCRPEEVLTQAAARIGLGAAVGRQALSAYHGFLGGVLRPVVLSPRHTAPLPSLDEVAA